MMEMIKKIQELLTVKQNFFVSSLRNVSKTVWKTCILTFGCQELLERNTKEIVLTLKGCPVATTAGFVLFKAEMVLQDQKGTKAKRDTEENKALRGPQATL